MTISGGSWLIIIIGIVVCFAGICFKKLFEVILGFIWGFATGYLIIAILALAGNKAIRNIDDSSALFILIVAGLLLAALSVALERLMMAIRGFLISFFIMMLVLAAASNDMEMTTALGIAVIIAFIVAGVMWAYYKYAFIIECAITGSIMINHVGLLGGADPSSFMSNALYGGYMSADNSTSVFFTVLVAIAGIVVQSIILSKIEGGLVRASTPDNDGTLVTKKEGSISSLFPDSHIRKANYAALRGYEKYLIIAPILVFLVLRFLSRFESGAPSAQIYDLIYKTGRIRYYLELICTGIFEGALIYFVIYYEMKVSAIYQLFALIWLPLELLDLIRYHFSNVLSSNPKYIIMSIGRYVLIWALLLVLDYALKNEVLKTISMCMVTIFMIAAGISFIFYGHLYFYFDINNFIHWSIIVMTLIVLICLGKKNIRCYNCGTAIIDGDTYCRHCGDKVIV